MEKQKRTNRDGESINFRRARAGKRPAMAAMGRGTNETNGKTRDEISPDKHPAPPRYGSFNQRQPNS
jgi:hypothetical protein